MKVHTKKNAAPAAKKRYASPMRDGIRSPYGLDSLASSPRIQAKREEPKGNKSKGFELPEGHCYARTDQIPTISMATGDHGPIQVKDGTVAKMTVRFQKGCTRLMGDSYAKTLNTIAGYMGAGGMETYYLAGAHIHGFASSEGSPEFNNRLSAARADYVREILLSNGLPPSQIKTTDYHGPVEGPLPAMRKVEVDLVLKKKPPGEKDDDKEGCEGIKKYLYPWCWELPDVDWPNFDWPDLKFWDWDWDKIWERIQKIWKFLVRIWDCHCTIAFSLDLFNSKFAKSMPQLSAYIEGADCACNSISALTALGSVAEKGMGGAIDFVNLLVAATTDCFSLAAGQIKDMVAAIFFPTVPLPEGVPLPLDILERFFPDTSWIGDVRDFFKSDINWDQTIDTQVMLAQELISHSFTNACESCLGVEKEKMSLGLEVGEPICQGLFYMLYLTGTYDSMDDKVKDLLFKNAGKLR